MPSARWEAGPQSLRRAWDAYILCCWLKEAPYACDNRCAGGRADILLYKFSILTCMQAQRGLFCLCTAVNNWACVQSQISQKKKEREKEEKEKRNKEEKQRKTKKKKWWTLGQVSPFMNKLASNLAPRMCESFRTAWHFLS